MTNYIFHVRPWNVDLFLALETLICESDKSAKFNFWTMQSDAHDELRMHGKDSVYLPDEFESHGVNKDNIQSLEKQLVERFGIGLNFVYQLERFKPDISRSTEFIEKQADWLQENIPSGSVLIGFTIDHFVYVLSSLINRLKEGDNNFIQPIGFPLLANVVLETPWRLKVIRDHPLEETKLDEYIASLRLHPEKSIHYMKPRVLPSIWQSAKRKIRYLKRPKYDERTNIFRYLEPHEKIISIDRLKKFSFPENIKTISLSGLEQISKNATCFYYPLQFEPEMSILAYSPFYQDQLEIIRLVSQSLNYGDVLVLKENPKMMGVRPDSFYKAIHRFPNVRWIEPKTNSREIIKFSCKVISITGTAAIEAAAMGRDSLIFGSPPFKNLLASQVVDNCPLYAFKELLYKNSSREEISNRLRDGWSEFSRSVLFGNFVPNFQKTKQTTVETDELALSVWKLIARKQ